jgi:hypothetical protein
MAHRVIKDTLKMAKGAKMQMEMRTKRQVLCPSVQTRASFHLVFFDFHPVCHVGMGLLCSK